VQRSRSGDEYAFPTTTRGVHALPQLLDVAIARKLVFVPWEALGDPVHVLTIQGVTVHMFHVDARNTQMPKPGRRLRGAPHLYWVTGAELSGHMHLGPPMVFGVPVAKQTTAMFLGLPLKARYASKTPPLVLYHGTNAGEAISTAGMLKPSTTPGMLGFGVYLARWDKASTFGAEVVRCIVFPDPVRVMTASDVCTCGCGKAFVDHATAHGKGYRTTYIPDNSLPATRRAEWCIRDPMEAIVLDGLFEVSKPAPADLGVQASAPSLL
jgi:hypothetical protein